MNAQSAEKLLRQKVAELAEHFEGVQILATWMDSGDSHMMSEGSGNWYMRQGMARSFVESDTARRNAWEIKEATSTPPPEDGESWKSDA